MPQAAVFYVFSVVIVGIMASHDTLHASTSSSIALPNPSRRPNADFISHKQSKYSQSLLNRYQQTHRGKM
jgi:hypothetical protein